MRERRDSAAVDIYDIVSEPRSPLRHHAYEGNVRPVVEVQSYSRR